MHASSQTGSGPRVAWWFQRLFAANLVVAWLSLAAQVRVLYGQRGLLPIAELMAAARARDDLGFAELPTHFWLGAEDPVIVGTCWVGATLALLALLDRWTAATVAGSTALYLGMCAAGRDFLGFQWDSMVVECGALAALLAWAPGNRWLHLLFRVVLFKVFWESGLAKLQSAAGDWTGGTAMAAYYETAPLPTWLGWYAHHLPDWWHRLESWWTLCFELVLALGVWGGRRTRQVALVVFGGFLVVDAATANYGFFCTLTAALLLFLLDERDLPAVGRAGTARGPRWLAGLAAVHIALSIQAGAARFADLDPLPGLRTAVRTSRLVNTYHLFGTVTTTRDEVEVRVHDGVDWVALELHHKPGDPLRRPGFVAPHQPRVDFQLWFYGLRWQRGAPVYVQRLVERLCTDPSAMQPLFATPLPMEIETVELVFYDQRFTTPQARARTDAWWTRDEVGRSGEVPCARITR